MKYNIIPDRGRWREISATLNDNFNLLDMQMAYLAEVTMYNKGRFQTIEELKAAYADPIDGSYAYIGTQSPYEIWLYTKAAGWFKSNENGEPNEFDWTAIPTASITETGLMMPSHVQKLEDAYNKIINDYAPKSIVFMTEKKLEDAFKQGILEDGVLYLGTEEEEE
jgi:hypothetical protein